MKILALITARKNSKGVLDKNIREIGGVPLIGISAQHALAAGFAPEDVVLSTDSEEYAAVGRKYGASTPFLRPAELATDTAGSREVMIHAVDTLNRLAAEKYDTICLLQPTSPFRSPEDIVNAIRLYEERRPEMVVGVTRSGANPYYNLFETDEAGCLHISKGDGRYTRRQDAPPVYEFNGAIYIIDVEALRKGPITRFGRILPYVMPAERSLDIDSEADLRRAQRVLQNPEM